MLKFAKIQLFADDTMNYVSDLIAIIDLTNVQKRVILQNNRYTPILIGKTEE